MVSNLHCPPALLFAPPALLLVGKKSEVLKMSGGKYGGKRLLRGVSGKRSGFIYKKKKHFDISTF